jgi:transposase InsO family protein
VANAGPERSTAQAPEDPDRRAADVGADRSERREARILIEQWRWEYNTKRPHSSLGHRSPAEITEARVGVHPITAENLS